MYVDGNRGNMREGTPEEELMGSCQRQSFGLSREDDQDRDQRTMRIKAETG